MQNNRCVVCGAIVPEGTEVCQQCLMDHDMLNKNKITEVNKNAEYMDRCNKTESEQYD